MTLITIDVRGGARSPLQPLRSAAGALFGPVERASATVVRPVAGFVDDVRSFGSSKARIGELEREQARLRQQLRSTDFARSRAAELDKLLRVASAGQYPVVPARVIAIGPAQAFTWTVTIDAGSRDRLRPDLTVLNGDGLVGRIKSVTSSTATVLLMADPTARVGVRLERTLQVGVATGAGPGRYDVALLEPRAALAPGDRFVTFGSKAGAPFVPGVPVGEVVSVRGVAGSLTKRATVRPYVDFTSLDVVGVVVAPPRTDPRDAVLPPRAAGSPRPPAS